MRPRSAPPAARRTSRPSSRCPKGSSTTARRQSLAELRPEDEAGLTLARRVFADGRTRAYAWGRAIAREDLAAATERLIAMSGQFEQRRLARPSYQLDVLDAFAGDEQLRAAAGGAGGLARARRMRGGGATRSCATRSPRRRASRRCATSSIAARGWSAGRRTRCGRSGSGCATARSSPMAPYGRPRRSRPTRARVRPRSQPPPSGRSAPLTRLAPELEAPAAELRELAVRLNGGGERPAPVRRLARGRPGPRGGGRGAARPDRRAPPPVRRADARRAAGAARAGGRRAGRARRQRSACPRRGRARRGPSSATSDAAAALRARRASAAVEPFAAAVRESLEGVGMGEGEFRVELREREAGPSGTRRGRLPDPAQSGDAVRPGRRHRLGRRALPCRARARGRRGR